MVHIVNDPGFGICLIGKEHVGSYYLMHHGIKGQKHGIRRWQNEDGSYTPEGYQHYKEMYGWGERKKGTPISKYVRQRMNAVHGYAYDGEPEYSKKYIDEHPVPYEKLADLRRLSSGADLSEARLNANHPVEEGDYATLGRSFNCPNCACAFEMIERGYNVTARRKPDGSNVGNIDGFFKGGKLSHASDSDWVDDEIRFESRPKGRKEQKLYDKKLRQFYDNLERARENAVGDLRNELDSQGNGARGIIVVGWLMDSSDTESMVPTTAYHALNYKVENGVAKLYDVQSRRYSRGTDDFGMLYGCDPRELYLMRTDTLDIDESIAQTVYSRGRAKP